MSPTNILDDVNLTAVQSLKRTPVTARRVSGKWAEVLRDLSLHDVAIIQFTCSDRQNMEKPQACDSALSNVEVPS